MREGDAQAQASGAAAVGHGLLKVLEEDFGDGGAWILGAGVEELADWGEFAAMGGCDKEAAAIGAREQLGIEQVGLDGVVEGDGGLWDLEDAQGGAGEGEELGLQGGERGVAVEECAFMAKQDIVMADRDDIVVKDAGVDGGGVLLQEAALLGRDMVAAGDCLGGFGGLASGEAGGCWGVGLEGVATEDEKVESGLAGVGEEAGVVGGPFIGESIAALKGRVDDKVVRVAEDLGENSVGESGFDGAVWLGEQVGGGKMRAAVGGVDGWGDGGGVGRPHCGGGAGGCEDSGGLLGGGGEDRGGGIGVEAPRAQGVPCGARMRWQNGLRETAIGERLGFGEPLQRGGLRLGDLVAVTLRGDIAGRKPGVIMGWADQPVEIHFNERLHEGCGIDRSGLGGQSKNARGGSGIENGGLAMGGGLD